MEHWALLGMWVVGLPSAATPLWQVAQLPALVASWAKLAVAQVVVVLWQVSHCADVGRCVAGLTWALIARWVPLWQVEQLFAARGPVVAL